MITTFLSTEQHNDYVTLHFGIQNVSGADLVISYGSQPYDFIVTNEDGKEVYRWSLNKLFTAEVVERTLKRDEKIIFQERWNFQDNEGKPLPKGRYKVEVIFLIHLPELSEPQSFQHLSISTDIEL
ncbi:BsuPI-related putative proteinase inhibitor [Paenibacillus alvei]|uniref:BsuPI-related putative proteinase inhibitor n=1 Tax=Paenibacillus alvei TaxID=44250 RepID=UPI0002880673|nr:BsuPI-related putative proteinase inhibitor [Paenibacillus alvei]EJW17864.1 hypothetical protein PAV_3c03130 [Paenibacillus alvei DSM 29]MBG9733820.1 hypothetical protein [Paenibacillus alvei]MBG9743861.1 hypothetical protein [Paenibacillus alvei]MCY9544550.1 BsuPI-related putative proteinase inhibitor [Paenibacillus alvei]MCY9580334.1 BsuPI-related putative proteinase inhibitor [Paenibacillus alvei]